MSLGCAAATQARAESWFQFEAGLGGAFVKDMGDGTWIQQGAPNNRERQKSVAVMAGITGQLYQHGPWDVRYHADYIYIGNFSASVDGVPDANYDPVKHRMVNLPTQMRYSPFSGQGHVQGVPLTLDAGYTYRGWRLGAEAGAWVYWQTWHETLYNLADQWQDLSHRTSPQVGFVVGASVERGRLSVSYRYYQISARWNPYPGLATGAHVLMVRYRF
ncbi:hypothetical protein [Paraburkholderia caballeronis]|uniref:Outer membrane protein beta-barrel domain-containing protein n=1 Tax=Paraburkholderia caballeronis TaxID=416943 RepID=A0A1H7TZA8_9BURK|nr:hypothetical protein [Paraburkholderia caballeronis]PXW23420.1 hypothetical protein C7403_110158 [Paraburkholderia caballeronis]PXW98413.1 hypothetical protein C7407_110158 [Paraburkholderia caballeronis]RAJ95144.1 hypothetical protein C7409_110159 [Paraburkholderia caballeronis]SEC54577.1 hypothetical protein SAMN05445871_2402 [Paraburkholderia caballeronis]SEL90091.1 hypothetical protein SAMN05192542_11748 [Paraburkholderia caballeronis]